MDATGATEGVIGPATKLGICGESVAMNDKLEGYARPHGCMQSSKLTDHLKTLTVCVLAMLATGGSDVALAQTYPCLLYTSPSPRD